MNWCYIFPTKHTLNIISDLKFTETFNGPDHDLVFTFSMKESLFCDGQLTALQM